MLASPHRVLRFDAFTLDLTRRVVLRGDQQLPLRRQSFDVLQYLAEHAGVLISKDDLRQAVWPTTQVTPDSVVQCIKEIRQTLGEEARWIIRTVSGRGYVFMAEVVPAAPEPSASTASPEPGSAVQAGLDTELDTKESDGAPEGRPDAAPFHRRQLTMVAAGMLIAVLVVGGWLVWRQARPEPPAMSHHDGRAVDCGAPVRGAGQPPGRGQRSPRSVRRCHHRDIAALAARPHDLPSVRGRLPRRGGRPESARTSARCPVSRAGQLSPRRRHASYQRPAHRGRDRSPAIGRVV